MMISWAFRILMSWIKISDFCHCFEKFRKTDALKNASKREPDLHRLLAFFFEDSII